MNTNEENLGISSTDASSFGDGSFMSYEAPAEGASPQATDATDNTATVANASEPMQVSQNEADMEKFADGASSFDTDTFASYEQRASAASEARQSIPSSGAGGFGGNSGNGGPGVAGNYGGFAGDGGNGAVGGVGAVSQKQSGKLLGTFGWILFFASFPASFISLILMVISVIIGGGSGALPIAFMLAIPVASIVIGILLKKKSGEGTKNIVIGIIAGSFIALMLASSFGEINFDIDIDADSEDYVLEEFISSVEGKLSITFPEYDSYYDNSYYYDQGNGYYKSYDIEYYYTDSYASAVEICKSKYFVEQLPSTYIGLLPRSERGEDFEYCLLYNVDTDEYNKLPAFSGTYRMICVTFYDWGDGSGYFTVTEYDLQYTNQFNSTI